MGDDFLLSVAAQIGDDVIARRLAVVQRHVMRFAKLRRQVEVSEGEPDFGLFVVWLEEVATLSSWRVDAWVSRRSDLARAAGSTPILVKIPVAMCVKKRSVQRPWRTRIRRSSRSQPLSYPDESSLDFVFVSFVCVCTPLTHAAAAAENTL